MELLRRDFLKMLGVAGLAPSMIKQVEKELPEKVQASVIHEPERCPCEWSFCEIIGGNETDQPVMVSLIRQKANGKRDILFKYNMSGGGLFRHILRSGTSIKVAADERILMVTTPNVPTRLGIYGEVDRKYFYLTFYPDGSTERVMFAMKDRALGWSRRKLV